MAKGKGSRLSSSLVAKAIMIGINLAMMTFSVWEWGVFASFQQLTNIVLLLETVHLIASLKCSTDFNIKNKTNWLVLHHITFELICPINFLVVTVYWTVLREDVVLNWCDTPAKYFHTTIVHLLPFLFNMVAFYHTDIVIKASHALFLWPVGILYGWLNYLATQKQGYPVYSFLTWTDMWSPIFIILLTLSAVIFFISLASLTKTIKRGFNPDKNASK